MVGFLPYKILLLAFHIVVMLLALLLIRVQWRAGYNKMSWSSLFLLLSLSWLVLKLGLLVRWLQPQPIWTDAVFYTLYWLPTTLQCVPLRPLPPPGTCPLPPSVGERATSVRRMASDTPSFGRSRRPRG